MADDIEISVGLNLDHVDRDVGSLRGKLSGAFDIVKTGLGFALGGAITSGFHSIVGGLGDVVAGAQEAARVQAQLEAVLASTGGQAGVTAQMANDLAGALQRTSLFTDEAVLSGENMLLTFTNIGKDVFPDATKVMLDMSQALGQDVKSSALQLGKALNNPIEGVTALQRVGVQFTDAQKEQIKTLVESGRTMDAQKLILQELQKEFGGSAAAAANTQPWQVFMNLLDDLKENIVGEFLPVVNEVGKDLLAWLTDPEVQAGLQSLIEGLRGGLGQAVAFLREQMPPLLDFLKSLAQFLWDNRQAVAAVAVVLGVVVAVLSGPLTLIIGAIAGLIALLTLAWTKNFGGIQDKTRAVWAFIQPIFKAIFETLGKFWTEIQPKLADAWNMIQRVIQTVMNIIGRFIGDHMDEIRQIFQGAWTYIQGIFQVAWSIISGIVKIALDLLGGNFKDAGKDWQEMMNGIWEGVKKIIDGAWKAISGLVSLALSGLVRTMFEKLAEARQGVEDRLNGLIAWLQGLPGQFTAAAASMMQALIDGFWQKAGEIQTALHDIIAQALNAILGPLGIASPFGSPAGNFTGTSLVGTGTTAAGLLGSGNTFNFNFGEAPKTQAEAERAVDLLKDALAAKGLLGTY